MTFVREVIDGSKIANIIDMPIELKNRKVEILIFPIANTEKEKKKSNLGSLYGKYANYANPELRKKEDAAWREAVHE